MITMGTKRKPESPLISEPSSKIRRTDTHSDHENSQYAPVLYSPLPQEQVPSPSADSNPAPLTKANLRKLEKMTGSGSRSGKSAYSSRTGITSQSGGSKSHSTTDHRFEAAFRTNGGVDALNSCSFPPSNMTEIGAHLDRSRDSASPDSSQHRRFLNSLQCANNERDIESLMQGRVFKDTNKDDRLQDIDYRANVDKQWVAFPKDVGFNNNLSAPKPDLVEGYAQRSFPPFINELGGSATLVHDSETYVALPHFAAEFKDYGKSMREAEVQTGYDGAHMVYARNKALEYIGERDPPQRASPITVASDGHNWTVYSHHAHPNDQTGKLEYYQNEVASGRTVRYNDFKQSYKVLRNAQDWGRKESHDLRERLQRHEDARANQASTSTMSKAGPVNGAKASSSAYSSASSGGPRVSSRRASDAGSRRSDGQASVASSNSAGRPSMTGYAGTSRLGSNQQVPPSASKTMPPPPRRSSDAVSGRVADHRGAARSPSTTRYPPSASSGSRSGAGTPKSSKAPSVDSQQYADPRHSRPDKYRERRSDDDIQPVQRRRSDSPQDQPRPPRDMDRGRDRTRDSSRLGDSSRDAGRYARATSVGGSSSGGRYVARRSPSADRYSGR
ncbi:hypothetical protein N0V93_008202 [Gnomoniopsis smithogilvyi]|uniref:DUF7924 domain-containing protein n=1 Tax=Gnomoniopsis smithogilvyi TaxID=1191159 RepID=A0A9W8YMR4_9PEZI|nr:hypothetical protein N0V93_008202 [Gnomoniopsis smithogilvyi]